MAWRGAAPSEWSESPAASLPATVFLTGTKSFVVDRVLHDGARSLVLSAFAEYPFGILRGVALKFARGGAGPARLRREATAYTRVRHPSLTQLIEYGVDSSGQHVLVLDLYDGISVANWLRHLRDRGVGVPKPVAVLLALRLFEALQALHLARDPMTNEFSPIVHGNITTDNMLISWDGSVRVHDLGSSSVLARDAGRAQATSSHLFEALEHEETVYGNVRSDVFSACRLFRSLLHSDPLALDGKSRMTASLAFEDPGILSARLSSTLERGLHPEPELRNLSAADMVTALRAEGCSDVGQRYLQELLRTQRPTLQGTESLHRPSGVVPRRPALSSRPDSIGAERQEADTITPPPQATPAVIPPMPRPPTFENLTATGTATAAATGPATAAATAAATGPATSTPTATASEALRRFPSFTPAALSTIPPPFAFGSRGSLPSYSSVNELPEAMSIPKTRPRALAYFAVAAAMAAAALGGVLWTQEREAGLDVRHASAVARPKEPTSRSLAVGMTSLLRTREAAVAPEQKGMGYVRTAPEERGHRIFVDGQLAGGGGGSLAVACGLRRIRVGSQGKERDVTVPCGDEVYVTR